MRRGQMGKCPLKIQSLLAVLLLLTACADPLRNVARLDEVSIPQGAAVASALPGAAEGAGAPPVLGQLLAQTATAEAPVSDASPTPPPRRGFWASFGQAPPDAVAATAPPPDIMAEPTTQQVADDIPADTAPAPRQGFWAQVTGPETVVLASATAQVGNGPDAAQVPPGTLLPYGQMATVCGQPNSALGTKVASAAGYDLYDSAPNTTALRVQYLTGFPDGCARIFSAALVLFGDVGTHEAIRYLPSNAAMAYSRTDMAYEAVKAQFCGVASGHPCGAALDRLAAHSTFVTIYETFGTNPEWGEIFVHQGRVMAIDVRRG
jgi:hypothetical protein